MSDGEEIHHSLANFYTFDKLNNQELMTVKIKRILRKLKCFWPFMKGLGNITFSQFGEDIIMLKMLERHGVNDISYLDIGANEPILANNTYNFYLRGHRGVLVEPNVIPYNELKKVRPGDKCLNLGISNDNAKEADFYMFAETNNQMNTFSKEDAYNFENEGFKIEKVIKVPLKGINELIGEYFPDAPTVISLDVEGLDEIILNKLDFNKYKPLLICVETVAYKEFGEFEKRMNIIDLLISKGYFIYADTHVNTIFCCREVFNKLIK